MTRIYAVESDESFHLIEAKSRAAALRHVAEKQYRVGVASQKVLIGAMKDGVQIEVAANDEATETPQSA